MLLVLRMLLVLDAANRRNHRNRCQHTGRPEEQRIRMLAQMPLLRRFRVADRHLFFLQKIWFPLGAITTKYSAKFQDLENCTELLSLEAYHLRTRFQARQSIFVLASCDIAMPACLG